MHTRQSVAFVEPVRLLNVPGWQLVHAGCPAADAKVPSGQGAQLAAGPGVVVPGLQRWHSSTETRPDNPAVSVPAGQGEHSSAPATPTYVFGPQGRHADPLVVPCCPGWHALHTIAPGVDQVPVRQPWHSALPGGANVPASHSEHAGALKPPSLASPPGHTPHAPRLSCSGGSLSSPPSAGDTDTLTTPAPATHSGADRHARTTTDAGGRADATRATMLAVPGRAVAPMHCVWLELQGAAA